MRRSLMAMLVIWGGLMIGCGDDEFPDLQEGNLSSHAMDWVVEGMSCEGDEVTRFVGLVDEGAEGEEERVARYFRGDACVDAGDLFWEDLPTEDGVSASVRWNSSPDDWRSMDVEALSERSLRLSGEGEEVVMRAVYESVSPSPIPSLEGFDLSGDWWMEAYPCVEESVPQLVQAFHPSVDLRLTKIVGDECIGSGVSFVEGAIDGTRIEGEGWVEEPDELDELDSPEDNPALFNVVGTVRNEDFIRLGFEEDEAVGVSLRRVEDVD